LLRAESIGLTENKHIGDKKEPDYKIFRRMPKEVRDEIRKDILAALRIRGGGTQQKEGNELSKVPAKWKK